MAALTLDLIARSIWISQPYSEHRASWEGLPSVTEAGRSVGLDVRDQFMGMARDAIRAILSADLTEEQINVVKSAYIWSTVDPGDIQDDFRAILRTLLPRGSIVDTEA